MRRRLGVLAAAVACAAVVAVVVVASLSQPPRTLSPECLEAFAALEDKAAVTASLAQARLDGELPPDIPPPAPGPQVESPPFGEPVLDGLFTEVGLALGELDATCPPRQGDPLLAGYALAELEPYVERYRDGKSGEFVAWLVVQFCDVQPDGSLGRAVPDRFEGQCTAALDAVATAAQSRSG